MLKNFFHNLQFSYQVLWVMMVLVFSACTIAPSPTAPKAVQGILDLRNWDLQQTGPIQLDGTWEFYWDQSFSSLPIQPKPQAFMPVPGSWASKYAARGKAVYRLQIRTKLEQTVYGMKLYELPQSYRVYVNNKQILENGKYADNPENNQRSLVRPVAVFAHDGNTIDLRIEVSNLDESDPGPRRSILLGFHQDVQRIQENQLITDMLVAGVLLIMAAYHLGLYVQRRHEMSSLLFGILCIVMVFRIAVTEEHYLHKFFPAFSGKLEHILDVFSFFVLVPTFTWLFRYFFENEFRPWVLRPVTTIFCVFCLLYLIAPELPLVTFYLIFTLLVCLYLASVLVVSVKKKRSGASVFLAGFLLFLFTVVWDMLSYSNIIRSIYISQIGFVGFIFSQAYVLSIRFNQALAISEQLTVNLEALVTERTQALEASNQKLALLNITDGLTGIANRRHFDQMLEQQWAQALAKQQPLALLILDIDHFKAYNDHYGHQQGDECLKTVAQILLKNTPREESTVARYGGEEFVVLLANCTAVIAIQIAEKIRTNLELTALPHAKSDLGLVSVSIGVNSIVPIVTTSAHQWVRLTDKALYSAKHQGRNKSILAAETSDQPLISTNRSSN